MCPDLHSQTALELEFKTDWDTWPVWYILMSIKISENSTKRFIFFVALAIQAKCSGDLKQLSGAIKTQHGNWILKSTFKNHVIKMGLWRWNLQLFFPLLNKGLGIRVISCAFNLGLHRRILDVGTIKKERNCAGGKIGFFIDKGKRALNILNVGSMWTEDTVYMLILVAASLPESAALPWPIVPCFYDWHFWPIRSW